MYMAFAQLVVLQKQSPKSSIFHVPYRSRRVNRLERRETRDERQAAVSVNRGYDKIMERRFSRVGTARE